MNAWGTALAVLLSCVISASIHSGQPLIDTPTVATADDASTGICEAATSTLPNETILFRAHTHGYYNYLNPALLQVSQSVVLIQSKFTLNE